MVRVQQEARGRTTGGRTSGLPCAMVLQLIRALLGAPGFLATVSARSEASSRQRQHARRVALGISVGMPGPHDFAVRLMLFVGMIFSRCSTKASTASHPNVRDD